MKNLNNKSIIWPLLFVMLMPACGNVINDGFPTDSGTVQYLTVLLKNMVSESSCPAIDSTLADTGVFVSGSINNENGENVWLTHIDDRAGKEWERLLKGASTDRLVKARAVGSDDVLILADRYNSDGTRDIVIACLGIADGIKWQYCFGDDRDNAAFDATFTDDDDPCVIVTGATFTSTDTGDSASPFIMKIRLSTGSLLWCNEYTSDAYSMFIPHTILRLTDLTQLYDPYIVAGTCLDSSTGSYHVFFLNVDTGGAVIASRYMFVADKHATFHGVFTYDDIEKSKTVKTVISMLKVSGYDGTGESLCILTLDADLNVKKTKYDSFDDYNLAGRLVTGQDGDFYYAGMIRPEVDNGLYFLRYNKNGTLKNLVTRSYCKELYKLHSVNFISALKNNSISYVFSSSGSDGQQADIVYDRIVYDADSVSLKVNSSGLVKSGVAPAANILNDGDFNMTATSSGIQSRGSAGLELVNLN